MLFQETISPLPDATHLTLAKYKKDISVSLHKKVAEAIEISLETISSHYIRAHSLSDEKKRRIYNGERDPFNWRKAN